MKRLRKIEACADCCILITKSEDKDEWQIVLCNAVGCPLETRTINIEPKFVTMSQTHVIVADHDTIYYWQYRAKGASIESQKKAKGGKENIFHIEEAPKPDGNYDPNTWTKPSRETTDYIQSIAATTECFIVGRGSGEVIKFALPYIQQESKMNLRCRPQQMKLNCDGTKFSIIDINGLLSFYDISDTTDGP